jgi:hypothetical protein
MITSYGDAQRGTSFFWANVQIFRDSTPIQAILGMEGSNAGENQAFSLSVIDSPAAGTYTYSLKLTDNSNVITFGEAGLNIHAIELTGYTGPQGPAGADGVDGVSPEVPVKSYLSAIGDNETTTVVDIINTWYQMSATLTKESGSDDLLIADYYKIQNTSQQQKTIKVSGTVSVSTGSSHEHVSIGFYKNGTTLLCEESSTTSANGWTNIYWQTVVVLNSGQYISTYARNTSGTADIIQKNINIIVTEL